MQYHLDTIPVWDALKAHSVCPVCLLSNKLEADRIQYYLGGSVMEPDIRIQVNKKGFCPRHQQLLYEQKNKLGHALMMLSHTDEVLEGLNKSIDKLSGTDKPGKKALLFSKDRQGQMSVERESAGMLHITSAGCVICDAVNEHMNRYNYTFLHLFKNDTSFKQEFSRSDGLCLEHTAVLIQFAAEQFDPGLCREFALVSLRLLKDKLSGVREDLYWFTQKFDYRNQDKPWGNSKDALERVINTLQGHVIGKLP